MRVGMLGFVAVLLVPGIAAQAASPFDGTYRGTYTPAGNGNARCPAGTDMTIRVQDGKFTYAPQGEPERGTGTVAADGSFSAAAGQRQLRGKIAGGQMDASTSGGRCNYIWSLRKAG